MKGQLVVLLREQRYMACGVSRWFESGTLHHFQMMLQQKQDPIIFAEVSYNELFQSLLPAATIGRVLPQGR